MVPEGQVMTMAFAIGLSIEELKLHFAEELKVPAEVLHVSWNSKLSTALILSLMPPLSEEINTGYCNCIGILNWIKIAKVVLFRGWAKHRI